MLGLSSGIMQIAYVVEDIDRAVDDWTRLGIGPFFLRRHVEYSEFVYQGKPSLPDVSLAFAFSGETQIELVQQHDDAPSAFHDFRRERGYGMQHLGIVSHDIDRDVRHLAKAGILPVQSSRNARGIEAILFNADALGGGMLELVGATPVLLDSFAQMKAAAANWDGSDPRRE